MAPSAAEWSGVLPSKLAQKPTTTPNIHIVDIRHDAVEISIKDDILSQLRPASGLKNLPTLLLYNEQGLQLFEEVRFRTSVRAGKIREMTGYRSHTWTNTT